MKIFHTTKELRSELSWLKNEGSTIGFIPTMGALHKGHISLIGKSKKETSFTVCSIFVNPTQFNNPNDLKKYPRTLDKDIELLEEIKCDILFVPSEKEVYPEPDTRQFDFGTLGKVMEGSFRPGHFNGVAQVVSRFFSIINPHKAYFGEKDFQQLVIIRELVKSEKINVQIIGCPTVREQDGLAMSSRNSLLSPLQRQNAPLISQTLFKAAGLSKNGFSVNSVSNWVENQINSSDYLKVEYFQIVNEDGLIPVSGWNEGTGIIGCIAVYAGDVRLIDNVRFNL